MSKIDYIIPKIKVNVDILIDEGKTPEIEGYVLYLDEYSRYRTGKVNLSYFTMNTKNYLSTRAKLSKYVNEGTINSGMYHE